MTTVNKVIVLDLDDTLYPEIDFLKSAYHHISKILSDDCEGLYELMMGKYEKNEDVFAYLTQTFSLDKTRLLEWYRFHEPDISLYSGAQNFLSYYSENCIFNLVTDGRSKTQRNKIKALGLADVLHNIIISEEIGSEKPNQINFERAISGQSPSNCYYIGDNVKKDFITPNRMGWTTVCLEDQGQNIHKQDFTTPAEFQPTHRFSSWLEIQRFFDESL